MEGEKRWVRFSALWEKSATGKDTIYKRLTEDQELLLRRLVPYTTRPIRDGESEGREYHFVDEETLERLQKAGKVVELRVYDTVQGLWKYFTVCDDNMDLEHHSYAVIRNSGILERHAELFWTGHHGSNLHRSRRRPETLPCPGTGTAAGRTALRGTVQKISGRSGRFFRRKSEKRPISHTVFKTPICTPAWMK